MVGYVLAYFPSVFESHGHSLHGLSFAEVGVLALVAGAFIFVILKKLGEASLLPENHPYLKGESSSRMLKYKLSKS